MRLPLGKIHYEVPRFWIPSDPVESPLHLRVVPPERGYRLRRMYGLANGYVHSLFSFVMGVGQLLVCLSRGAQLVSQRIRVVHFVMLKGAVLLSSWLSLLQRGQPLFYWWVH